MNYIKNLKYSVFYMLCLAMLKNKKLIIPYIVLSLFFIIYLFNPYVNNSGDFIITSGNIAITVSCIFTFILGIWVLINYIPQLNVEIFSNLEDFKQSPLNIFLLAFIFLFTVSQTIILIFLIFYYYIMFGFSISMTTHISILYFNYIYLPLIFTLISSIYIYILIFRERYIKKTFYILLFILPFLPFLKVDTNFKNLFYITEHFYNPFTGITMYSSSLVFKLTIITFILCSIFLILKFVKKKSFIHFAFITFVTLTCLITSNFVVEDYQELYRADFVKNLKSVNNSNNTNEVQNENNYTVEKYDIAIKNDKPVEFNVQVSISDITSKTIKIYLNDAFRMINITSAKGIKLPYFQKGKEIVVNLNSLDNQTLSFKYHGIGTALNPVNSEYVFLPYFFNWLPSNETSNEYIFNNNSLDYRPYGYTCENVENFESDFEKIIVKGFEVDNKCISLIKGDFIKKDSTNTTYYIPRSWSGNIKGIDKYEEMKRKLILLFNDMFEENIETTSNSVFILPRFEDSPSENINDIWLSPTHEIYLLNPFLNVTKNSVFEQLYNETIAFYPFSLIRENVTDKNFEEAKLFSALFSIHFIESLNLKQKDKDALSNVYSLFPKEVIDFSKIEEEERERKLIEFYKALIFNRE